jgi:hypothetical protein
MSTVVTSSKHRMQRPRAAACVGVLLSATLGCGSGVMPTAAAGSSTAVVASKVASSPILGYTMDSSRAGLRAINGIPGASRLASGLIGSGPLSSSATCVRQSFALVADATGGVSFMSLPSGQTSRLSSGVSASQHLLISPSCTYALVYASDSSNAILISGLPSAPVAQSLTLASSNAGAAIGDLGSVLFAALRSDGSSTIQIIAPSARQPQPFSTMQKFGAMTFLPGTDTAVLADAAANTVTVVAQASTAPSFVQAATAQSGVANPLALASSADGRLIFVANSAAASILRVDLSGSSAPLKIACSCSPLELIPLAGNANFQLNEASTGTIFALAGDVSTPKTVFIPTDKVIASTGGVQ